MRRTTSAPLLSFLLPTRGNVTGLARLFQSLMDTTRQMERLEIILAVDEDDVQSQAVTHEQLFLTKLIVPRGTAMGALNEACYAASAGRFVMGMNDDVVVRTPGWDDIIAEVLARYPDDIALIHVNDLLFQQQLCTFPLVSRRACEAIGFCPPEYQRYRIDDHIYDVYQLLAYLGHRRIIYLPDVVFEHLNYSLERAAGYFAPSHQRVYVPNETIVAHDAAVFERSFDQRKEAAEKLARLIDASANERRRAVYERLLSEVADSFSYRQSEYVTTQAYPAAEPTRLPSAVTVAVITADLRQPGFQHCLAQIQKHTSECEVLVFAPNTSEGLHYPRLLNTLLRLAHTDFVAVVNEAVLVEAGWLTGLIQSVDETTGLSVPLLVDRKGAPLCSGLYFKGDGSGSCQPTRDKPERSREAQAVWGALLLIDRRKCGQLRFDENYRDDYWDIDYSLKVWEAGYKVVCASDVVAVQLGRPRRGWLNSDDKRTFVEQWVKTGRLLQLEEAAWARSKYLRVFVAVPQAMRAFFRQAPALEFNRWRIELRALAEQARPYRLFREGLIDRLLAWLFDAPANNEKARIEFAETLVRELGGPPASVYRARQWLTGVWNKTVKWLKSNPETHHLGRTLKARLKHLLHRYPSLHRVWENSPRWLKGRAP